MENGKTKDRSNCEQKFGLGKVLITPNALQELSINEISDAIQRHARGDWGVVDPEDWEANNAALREGRRLLSAYQSRSSEVFWIITERDRCATTILMPNEY